MGAEFQAEGTPGAKLKKQMCKNIQELNEMHSSEQETHRRDRTI